MTKKELLNILKNFDDNAVIVDIQLQGIVHVFETEDGDIVLSSSKPIGKCNRTGADVYPSAVDGYSAYCPELDEDLYDMEWTANDEEL